LFRELPNIEKGLPHVQVRPPGLADYRCKRGSIGACLVIDGFGITLHSLRHGLVDYEVACWAPGNWIGSSRAV